MTELHQIMTLLSLVAAKIGITKQDVDRAIAACEETLHEEEQDEKVSE